MDIDAFLKDPLAAAEMSPEELDAFASGADEGDLEAAVADGEGEAGSSAQAAQQGVQGASPGAAEPAAQDAQTEQEPPEQVTDASAAEPEVILTRDGKNAIPYDVLKRERDMRRAAEAQLAELRQAGVKPAQPAAPPTAAQAAAMSPEQMAALREEAPALAAMFDAMRAELDALKGATHQVAAVQHRAQQDTVQGAIDSVPKLAFVQSLEDKAAYNAIVDIDQMLRRRPAYQGIPLADRFAKAVAMYEAEAGPIDLPGRASPAATERVQAKAAAAIAAAAAAVEAPHTLSDIPGGHTPAKNTVLDEIAAMTAAELTEKFAAMDPADLDKALARFTG